MARLIVTCRDLLVRRRFRAALKHIVPGARVRGGGFGGVFVLDVEGEPFEVARGISAARPEGLGRITAVIVEVRSDLESVREAGVKVATEHVGPGDRFCFRIHKRGEHGLAEPSPQIEVDIGTAIWQALEGAHRQPPVVDLSHPTVIVVADVMGLWTALGIRRPEWGAQDPSGSPAQAGAAEGLVSAPPVAPASGEGSSPE